MFFDLRNSTIRIFICPHRIDGLLASSGNAVVTAVAFIWTVSSVICPFQLGKIDIFAGNVMNWWIVRFPKCQGIASIRNHTARNRYDDASGIPLDGYRMIRTWNVNLFLFHVSTFV